MAAIQENGGSARRVPFIGENLQIYYQGDALAVNIGNTAIKVETAKKPGRVWNRRVREDIETARASYRVAWGDVPVWDEFDKKQLTHNYIAYIHYHSADHGEEVMEAISNRMVIDKPEDLEFYAYEGRPLTEVLPEVLYRQRGIIPRKIAGESRIGAIRPPHAKSNEKTLEAFAAIKLQMVQDARELGVDYIACQLKPDLSSSVLKVKGLSYGFPRTEELLSAPIGSVRLDRHNPIVAKHILRYPGYFLDTNGVYEVINRLFEEGELSQAEFHCKTGLESIDDLKLSARNIKEITPLLDPDMPFGITLRSRLLRDVPDGTYSSISHVDQIEERALSILQEVAQH